MLSQDGANFMGAAYLASSAKAQQELGWHTRPLEEGLRETFTISRQVANPSLRPPRSRRARLPWWLSPQSLGCCGGREVREINMQISGSFYLDADHLFLPVVLFPPAIPPEGQPA
jgi:hypothetical protein